MPTWLGGREAPGGGGDRTHVDPNGPRARTRNANLTPENATAIVSAAKELGTTPEDLATVIGYETGGSYSPSKWGGAGGHYMGLIQFGPPERAQFGANDQQTFPDQMHAVVRYLKARGYKPGMGLLDLYSTINAGSPGHYDRSDGNGTVRQHVARMQVQQGPTARAFVAMAPGAGQTASPVTLDHAITHTLALIRHAQRMTDHGGKPVPVTMDEKGMAGIGRRTFANYLAYSKAHASEMPMAKRPDLHAAWHGMGAGVLEHHRALMAGAGLYHHNPVTNHYDQSSDTKIATVNIHTRATDAKGIASDLEPIFDRAARAGRVNYGLA